ncbi:MAG: prephenate dehydratase domain-containing protein [Euryarchaeota archaeon]|nr:prephenate dehydratase domain-containing protein [Euryarchaeota archaeon]
MTVACLGPEGTVSHAVAERLFGDDIILLPTIRSVFSYVEDGKGDGLVPVENSEAGGVGETMEGFRRTNVYITGELPETVCHYLASDVGLNEISVLYAHPQTHEQCSDFTDSLGIPVVHTASNAASVDSALKIENAGALTSLAAAGLRDLPVIRREVQNSSDNVTRFVVISGRLNVPQKPEKCSILVDPHSDRAGLLHDLLSVFRKRDINLSRIESRPSKRGMGSYVFFIDFNAEKGWKDVVDELGQIADLKNLGCYNRLQERK